MSAPAVTPAAREAQDYLAAVEHELADLPVDDRSALLEDLALHLDALATEDDDRPIAVRLGPAAAYASDLRAAAGLPARGTGVPPSAPGLRARLDDVRASAAFRRALPVLRATGRLLAELRPAWWVLRGYLLVAVPCLAEPDGDRDFPVPAPLGSNELGLVLVVVAIAGSVSLGRRRLPRAAAVVVACAGAALALGAFLLWFFAAQTGLTRFASAPAYYGPVVEQATGEYPLLSRYGPVTDVLPYSADGTPLDGVLLFDQDGRPLQVGFQEWWADNCARVLDQPRAADGVPVPYSFPQNYVLDPAGVDLSRVVPRPPDSCLAEVPRPEVPIPAFPSEAPADPSAATD